MAVGALPGFFGADGMGNKRGVGLARKAGRGDRLLLVVEPLAIGVLRADENGATGAGGGDAMAADGSVDAEHVDVIAQHLEVVAGVVARREAFVVQHGAANVGGHLQVATETSWRPGGVAGVAGHAGVSMGERFLISGSGGKRHAVFAH